MKTKVYIVSIVKHVTDGNILYNDTKVCTCVEDAEKLYEHTKACIMDDFNGYFGDTGNDGTEERNDNRATFSIKHKTGDTCDYQMLVKLQEQEIDVPYATDRRKYGMTLQEVADQIRDFTGDTRGEAKRKAKIFAHHISLRHVSDIRNLRYGHRTDEHGNRTEDHDWLEIEWRDLDGDRDTFSIIE